MNHSLEQHYYTLGHRDTGHTKTAVSRLGLLGGAGFGLIGVKNGIMHFGDILHHYLPELGLSPDHAAMLSGSVLGGGMGALGYRLGNRASAAAKARAANTRKLLESLAEAPPR